jgi:hypothetical protein
MIGFGCEISALNPHRCTHATDILNVLRGATEQVGNNRRDRQTHGLLDTRKDAPPHRRRFMGCPNPDHRRRRHPGLR